MIRRVTAMSDSLLDFSSLSPAGRAAALRSNADLMVSLRAAVFFEEKKRGLEQVSQWVCQMWFPANKLLGLLYFPRVSCKRGKNRRINFPLKVMEYIRLGNF